MNDEVECPHCGYACNIGSLIGPRTNDCPRCGFAVLSAKQQPAPQIPQLTLSDTQRLSLAEYIADYIAEERDRGNTNSDKWMVADAIEAYLGGAR